MEVRGLRGREQVSPLLGRELQPRAQAFSEDTRVKTPAPYTGGPGVESLPGWQQMVAPGRGSLLPPSRFWLPTLALVQLQVSVGIWRVELHVGVLWGDFSLALKP